MAKTLTIAGIALTQTDLPGCVRLALSHADTEICGMHHNQSRFRSAAQKKMVGAIRRTAKKMVKDGAERVEIIGTFLFNGAEAVTEAMFDAYD